MAEVSAEPDTESDFQARMRRPLHILPLWVIPIGAAVVIVATCLTLRWMLPIAGKNPSLRIDAIRDGLSVGAAAGGAAALLLALRRQWLFERTQAHAEDVAHTTALHADRVARQDNVDAIERRVTDLYSRAVEQLGHTSAPVRLGGLYSLERLASAHPEHRQTVVDVICAYLRMPFRYPAFTPPVVDLLTGPVYLSSTGVTGREIQTRNDQELQVRQAALRILTRHLAAHTYSNDSAAAQRAPETFWGALWIDLNGASLHECDFSDCHLGDADSRNAQFLQRTLFNQARFTGEARFGNAVFCRGLSFGDATFEQEASFAGTVFDGNARFDCAVFSGEAWFDDTVFRGEAHFSAATFAGIARFDDAEFHSNSWIDSAKFSTSVWFGGTRFTQGCEFDKSSFAYRQCHSSWPAGWRLEPVTEAIAKLTREKPVSVGIARYYVPGTDRVPAGPRSGSHSG